MRGRLRPPKQTSRPNFTPEPRARTARPNLAYDRAARVRIFLAERQIQ
jgi:hypothetical protein